MGELYNIWIIYFTLGELWYFVLFEKVVHFTKFLVYGCPIIHSITLLPLMSAESVTIYPISLLMLLMCVISFFFSFGSLAKVYEFYRSFQRTSFLFHWFPIAFLFSVSLTSGFIFIISFLLLILVFLFFVCLFVSLGGSLGYWFETCPVLKWMNLSFPLNIVIAVSHNYSYVVFQFCTVQSIFVYLLRCPFWSMDCLEVCYLVSKSGDFTIFFLFLISVWQRTPSAWLQFF